MSAPSSGGGEGIPAAATAAASSKKKGKGKKAADSQAKVADEVIEDDKLDAALNAEEKEKKLGLGFFDVRMAFKHSANVRDLKQGPELENLRESMRTSGFKTEHGQPSIMFVKASEALAKGWVTPAQLDRAKALVLAGAAAGVQWEDDVPSWFVSRLEGKPFKEQKFFVPVYHAGMTDDELIVAIILEGHHRAVACQQLYATILQERQTQPATPTCLLTSPYLPAIVYRADTSAQLVQRISYETNVTGHTNVSMDASSQFTSFRNAIALRMNQRHKEWMEAKSDEERKEIKPFAPFTPQGKADIMHDLGQSKWAAAHKALVLAYYAQYEAFLTWGSTPAAADAAPLYVTRLRLDQSTADSSQALHNAGVPVPFLDNPALRALQVECTKGASSRIGPNSLKLFTNDSMTAKAGYVTGCAHWLLRCVLTHVFSGKKTANPKPEQMVTYLALLHQSNLIEGIKADSLAELKKYKVPNSDELSTAENEELIRARNLVDVSPSMTLDVGLVKEAVTKLMEAIARFKSHDGKVVVQRISALEKARSNIRQMRVQPFIAKETAKLAAAAEEQKLIAMRERQAAMAKAAEAAAQAAGAEEARKATERKQADAAAAALAAEDPAEKKAQDDLAKSLQMKAQQEAKDAEELKAAAKIAAEAATAATASEVAAVKEGKDAEMALAQVPPSLPSPTSVEVGLAPPVRKVHLKKQERISNLAQQEISDLALLAPQQQQQQQQTTDAAGDEMMDETSDISGATTTTKSTTDTSKQGTALSIEYLQTHFPLIDADVPTTVAKWVENLANPVASEEAPQYDFITMHPPGVHPGSSDYPDQPLANSVLLQLVEDAARLLKPGATMAIHCTYEQSVTIMQPVLSSANQSYYGCKGERVPLVWYHSGGDGGRSNQSTALVQTSRFIVLLHKLDSDGKSRANYTFSGHQSFKTGGGPYSNVWPQSARDPSQSLTVDRNNWEELYEEFKSKKLEVRTKSLVLGTDGHYTVPLSILSEKNKGRPLKEAHEGPDYRPSDKKKGKRGEGAAAATTTAAASEPGAAAAAILPETPPDALNRAYSGDRTDRLILDKSEIPWDVHQRLFKIFLPEAIDNSYAHVQVLDLFSGTQSAAACATRWPSLTVTNMDFNPVVSAAARVRLMRLLTECLPEREEKDELKQDKLQESLFYRFDVDGLTAPEINAYGADLGCEVHRQRMLFYTRMLSRSKNCNAVDAVCKSCGKELVEFARDPTDKSKLKWLTKSTISASTRRAGFCGDDCQLFYSHVVHVEDKNTGGRLLRNYDNLAQTAFAPYEGPAALSGTSTQQDAARWKPIPEPKGADDPLDFECRQALEREHEMWSSIEVVFSNEGMDSDTTLGVMPTGVRCAAKSVAAGEVLCCFTGALNEDGREAAKVPFQRPPLDITSGLWHQLAFNDVKGKITRRQLMRLSRLCAASYIQPSDAAHPANVTIAPNHLAMYRYSLIADHSILPPGAFCAISNRTIHFGEMLYFDAKQLVTEQRDKFSTAPVLTSGPHEVAQVAAGAASDASLFTYVQPWFPVGWPQQLEEQNKLIPKPRRAKAKPVEVLPKWVQAEVMSDNDDDIEHRFKAKPSSSKRRVTGSRASVRNLPPEIRDHLRIDSKDRQLVFDESVGWKPAPEDEAIFKQHAQHVLDLLTEHNLAWKRSLDAEATAAKYGVKDDEEKEVFPIDSFVADKLAEYAKEMESLLEPKPLRVRMRELPKISLEEIRALKGRGKDTQTQEELQRELGEDETGLSNCCLGHSYVSLVAEDVEKLNQLSLIRRKQFWKVLLPSQSLRIAIGDIASRSSVKEWQLCKIFLQQYCKILDTHEKRVKTEGALDLSQCPTTPADSVTEEMRWVSKLNKALKVELKKSDIEQMLPATHALWMRFTRKPAEVCLGPFLSEAMPDQATILPGLFLPTVGSMLLPTVGLEHMSATEISAAVASANQWNDWLYRHRKHGYGPGPYTLRTYHTLMGDSVPKAFADAWDAWDASPGEALEPQPEPQSYSPDQRASIIQIIDAFKVDRKWRRDVWHALGMNTPVSSTATTAGVSTPVSHSDDESDASDSVIAPSTTATTVAGGKRTRALMVGEEEKEGGQKEGVEQKEGEQAFKKSRHDQLAAVNDQAIGMEMDEPPQPLQQQQPGAALGSSAAVESVMGVISEDESKIA